MSSDNEKPYFVKTNNAFAESSPADDYLHPERNKLASDASLTETQYLAFAIPEARIHGFGYLWHHPNLNSISAGILVWQGVKGYMQEAEICDFRVFMNDDALKGDLHSYRLDNGYGVEVLEPMNRLRMTYDNPEKQSSVDVEFEAVSPAVMYADGNHFEQAMRVRGELLLKGKHYNVDCFTVRDRSWGKPRPEDNYPLPPMSWMNATFNDRFAFNCNLFDDARMNPELRGTKFDLPAEKVVNGGWLWKDGKVARIVKGTKRVNRDYHTFIPHEVEIEITDELNRTVHAKGTMISALPYNLWFNSLFMAVQYRWECEGMTTYGDSQDAMWSEFLHEFKQ